MARPAQIPKRWGLENLILRKSCRGYPRILFLFWFRHEIVSSFGAREGPKSKVKPLAEASSGVGCDAAR